MVWEYSRDISLPDRVDLGRVPERESGLLSNFFLKPPSPADPKPVWFRLNPDLFPPGGFLEALSFVFVVRTLCSPLSLFWKRSPPVLFDSFLLVKIKYDSKIRTKKPEADKQRYYLVQTFTSVYKCLQMLWFNTACLRLPHGFSQY